jgi:pyruvate dehydrogenase (quinone)
VLTDRQELVMPPEIKLEQAKGFSLWMMKAVLNGQANEIVDVAKTALRSLIRNLALRPGPTSK